MVIMHDHLVNLMQHWTSNKKHTIFENEYKNHANDYINTKFNSIKFIQCQTRVLNLTTLQRSRARGQMHSKVGNNRILKTFSPQNCT